jgi:hypothetical protein
MVKITALASFKKKASVLMNGEPAYLFHRFNSKQCNMTNQQAPDMYLNEFHRQQSERMVKYVSEQPLMSLEACIEQAKQLKAQPRKILTKKQS